jgi:hypothetical protein
MRSQFLLNKKTVVNGAVVEMRGHQMATTAAMEAIAQLKKLYDKSSGWRLTHWVENRNGGRLVDFEMEAERSLDGDKELVVMFSMVRQVEPVRRYR